VVLYEYDAAGRIALKTLGNGVYTTYDYDAAGQLLHLVNHKADATVLSRFDYSYDSRGRRISMGTLDGAWTYSYDDIGQLTHAVFASTNPAIPDQDLLYVYDAMGNRIRTVENGVTTAYTTNNLNQYTQVGRYHLCLRRRRQPGFRDLAVRDRALQLRRREPVDRGAAGR
jgi:YD repeat-containing protein